jgi:hypothetical protein
MVNTRRVMRSVRAGVGVVTVGAAALGLSACGSGEPEQVTVTVTEEATADPTPSEAEVPESEPPATEPAVDEPAVAPEEPAAPAEEATFVVPVLAGVNLQDAQDLLQTLDSYVMDQVDATGLERFAVNDSNWRVCSQDPAPGAVVPVSAVVTLAAVKLDEACP